MKKCQNCGAPFENETECVYCGSILNKYDEIDTNALVDNETEEQKSKTHQHKISPLDFSANTYHKYKKEEDNALENEIEKSLIVYQLLGLFLGCLGIHNFYTGYYKRAVVQILITLSGFGISIVFIWALIEIFMVKKDANGRKLK